MAKYIIIEIQKFADGTIATPPINTEDTFNEARSVFFGKCAVAAVSDVPVHSVVLLTETGQTQGLESFNHTETVE
ncbi:MAG: hypothetical protein IKE56_07865 [Lachnospiraceae bacterium]|nr:hypothetical protein [Lachnospiraceae bacterium]